MNGWGPKSLVCPSKPREIKLFWRDIPGFCRDIPAAECTKIARFSAVAAAIFTAPQTIARFLEAPRCAISSAKQIAREPRFLLRRKWIKMVLAAEFLAISSSAVKIASERRCAILVHLARRCPKSLRKRSLCSIFVPYKRRDQKARIEGVSALGVDCKQADAGGISFGMLYVAACDCPGGRGSPGSKKSLLRLLICVKWVREREEIRCPNRQRFQIHPP